MRTTILSLLILAAGCGGDDSSNNGGQDMAMQMMQPGLDMAMPAGGGDMAGVAACNILSQNCADSSMPRCTIQVTGAGTMMQSSSLACSADGTIARDAACTFDANGFDDCLKGNICTTTGSSTTSGMCRKVCASDNDCGAQRCARRGGGGGGGTTSSFGVCIPTCTEFGTECGTGATCAQSASDIQMQNGTTVRFLTCRPTGTGMPGDSCSRTMPCGADMLCLGQGGGGATAQCSPLCDGTHMTCTMLAGQPDGGAWSCQATTITGVMACQ